MFNPILFGQWFQFVKTSTFQSGNWATKIFGSGLSFKPDSRALFGYISGSMT